MALGPRHWACPRRGQALASRASTFRLFSRMRTHYCGQVNESLTGKAVTVAGLAHRRRDHGGVIFVALRDREGLLQIGFDPDQAAGFAMAERGRHEVVLKGTGLVRA